jgi:hypothetical protein
MFAAVPLPGLPPYGPPALSFPQADAYSEGFVVEFTTTSGDVWVGNFATWKGRQGSVHAELGPGAVLIVAGGAGYVVDADERRLIRDVGFDLDHVWFDEGLQAFVVSDGIRFEAFDAERILWRSRRFSWDGIRNVKRAGSTVTGEAIDAPSDEWIPFRLDLTNGEVEGGSWNEPDI